MLTRLQVLTIVSAAAVAVLALFPISFIVLQSLSTGLVFLRGSAFAGLSNFASTLSDSIFQTTVKNTVEFAFGLAVLTTLFGVALALAFTYLSFPFRRALELLILAPILISPLSMAIGWVFIAAPGGYVPTLWESFFGFPAPWNIYSFFTVILINSFYLVPVMYLMLTPALRSIDASYEEACRVSGGSPFTTIRRVTLPMIRNALLAALVLIILDAIEQFSIPLILSAPNGTYLATTYINYLDSQSPPQFGAMAAVGLLIVGVSVFLVLLQRRIGGTRYGYASVRSGFRPVRRKVTRRSFRYLVAAGVATYGLMATPLPMLGVIYRSIVTIINPYADQFSLLTLRNFRLILSDAYLSGSLLNTLEVSLIAASIGTVLSVMVAYSIVKSRSRGSNTLDYLATVPMAVPGLVMGIGFLFAWSRVPLPVYGTIWILIMAYITRYLPLGFRTIASGISQVDQDLEHSFRVCGGSAIRSFYKVLLPLIRPALAAAWVLLFIHFVYELSTSYLLYSYGSQVSTVVMVQLFNTDPGALSALALIQFLLVVAVFVPFRKSVASNVVYMAE